MPSSSDSVVVTSRGRARISAGHPWVFRQDVVRGPDKDAGDGGPTLVRVQDERGRPLGTATWAARARLALRMVDGDSSHVIDDLLAVVDDRLGAALSRRGGIGRDRDAYRVVHGESDGLPGLFVDVYADAAVMQTASVAMNAHRERIADLLMRRLGVRLVVSRDDGSARDFEDLPRFSGILAGTGATEIVYRLGDNELFADLLIDGKTGGFLDQADNHARVAALAPRGARALDAFTYHGGFALALARRGGLVLATDENPAAVTRATANAVRNGLPNMEVRCENAFDLLRRLESENVIFDVVVIDPPAFAKRQSGPAAADRAYKEVMLRGMRLTAKGGLAVLCSCSGRVSRAHFDDLVVEAAGDSGRSVQVVERRGAGADHPELLGVPETAHLKCWIVRIV